MVCCLCIVSTFWFIGSLFIAWLFVCCSDGIYNLALFIVVCRLKGLLMTALKDFNTAWFDGYLTLALQFLLLFSFRLALISTRTTILLTPVSNIHFLLFTSMNCSMTSHSLRCRKSGAYIADGGTDRTESCVGHCSPAVARRHSRGAAVACRGLTQHGNFLTTGIIGTKYIMEALTAGGRADIALALVRFGL